jgi:hypothetical protein
MGQDLYARVLRVLDHLKLAEKELLEVIHPGNRPPNELLLQVHTFVRIALVKLSSAAGQNDAK